MKSEKLKVKREKFAAAILLLLTMLTGCKQEDDTIVYQQSRRWVEKRVAVVAPTSADAATKARFERTAQWFLSNLHEAQLHDTLCIQLNLEWHDELTEDMAALGEQLAGRDDVLAVIGPFANESVALLAPACQKTHKPVIAPTATSENVIRRFAVGTAGVENKEPFLWSLTETDVAFSEVLMNVFASYIGYQGVDGYDTSNYTTLFAPADTYGQTFYDWAPFQAEELGIPFHEIHQYASTDELSNQVEDYFGYIFEKLGFWTVIFNGFKISSFCVVETTQQLYEVMRQKWLMMGNDPDAPETEAMLDLTIEALARFYFAFSNLTDESLAALDENARAILQGTQGFSPYADPTTGFENSYEQKFGTKPTFAECKFYDALMLAAFAASYLEHRDNGDDRNNEVFNQAIIAITTPTGNQLSGAAWSATSMELYLSALEQGQLMDFAGASGDILFDSENYTSALHTTYVHWQIWDGKVTHLNYLSSDGSHRTSAALAAWNWSTANAEASFEREAKNQDAALTYPTLTNQYAVLVQGSNGWNNYRHQADVLSVYQQLKQNGYDDEHIILIIDKALATDARNANPGVVRSSADGPNLLAGAVVDYDNATLTAADISDILLGNMTATTPVVLPRDAGQNVLLYWSGHGHNKVGNGANELVWLGADTGQGFTDERMHQTVAAMHEGGIYRKLFVITEPCYSQNVITPLVGIPGVLAMCGAGAYEQSFADNWNSDLGVWMRDRFTYNLLTQTATSPASTYRDLYLYCAQHTLGSHVHIVNSANFGNLYTTGPREFFVRE